MFRVTKLAASAILLALGLTACYPFGDKWHWNQKLTVEVTTPEGVRSGSAVSYVGWNPADGFSGNYPGGYHGEATVVDMGGGRFLFALIGEETPYIAIYTFRDQLGKDGGISESSFALIARIRSIRDVPRDRYPLLVTFGDIADPATVRRVDPDDLAASFGPGISLRRVALEITDERVTEGSIEPVLPWLKAVGKERTTLIPNPPRLRKDAYDPEIQYLSPGPFSTELYK